MSESGERDGGTNSDVRPKIACGATLLVAGSRHDAVTGTEIDSSSEGPAVAIQRLPRAGELVDDRYRIVREIGAGGMGCVYEVTHKRLDKTYALKVLHPDTGNSAAVRSQFFREAKLASSFQHASLVSVIDYGDRGEYGPFMVMEHIEGRIMSDYVATKGLPSMRRACELILQIAEGLDHVHAQNVVHCDVKPQNVILSQDPGRRTMHAKILDFGLARTGASKPTKGVLGTPEYLPPEVIMQEALTGAADVYSLGCVFFELLTGTVPFVGTVQEILMGHVSREVPPLIHLCKEDLDSAIVALVSRALEKKVHDRHDTMAAFIYELKNAMDMRGFGKKKFRQTKTNGGISPSLRVKPPEPEPAQPVVSITFDAVKKESANERELILASSFEALMQPVALVSQDGQLEVVNLAFAELLVSEASTLEGMNLSDTALFSCWPELEVDLESAACGIVVTRELQVVSPDGTVEHYHGRLEPSLKSKTLSLVLVAAS